MRISFDPSDRAELQVLRKLLDLLDSPSPWGEIPPAPPGFGMPPTDVPPPPPPSNDVPPPPPPPGVDVDVDGVPWSAEVHSSSRAKTADGRWRRKRSPKQPPPPPATLAVVPHPPAAATGPTWKDILAETGRIQGSKAADHAQIVAALQFAGIEITTLFTAPERWPQALEILRSIK